MRISDWSSDVCSSDLVGRRWQRQFPLGGLGRLQQANAPRPPGHALDGAGSLERIEVVLRRAHSAEPEGAGDFRLRRRHALGLDALGDQGEDGLLGIRSEEHTSELQSLMRISYAVFCLK